MQRVQLSRHDCWLLDDVEEIAVAARTYTLRYMSAPPSTDELSAIARLGHLRPLLLLDPWKRDPAARLVCFARWPREQTPSVDTLGEALLTQYLNASCRDCGSRWRALVVDFDLVDLQPSALSDFVGLLCPKCRASLLQVVTDILGPA